jgi:hypothetical protein
LVIRGALEGIPNVIKSNIRQNGDKIKIKYWANTENDDLVTAQIILSLKKALNLDSINLLSTFEVRYEYQK